MLNHSPGSFAQPKTVQQNCIKVPGNSPDPSGWAGQGGWHTLSTQTLTNAPCFPATIVGRKNNNFPNSCLPTWQSHSIQCDLNSKLESLPIRVTFNWCCYSTRINAVRFPFQFILKVLFCNALLVFFGNLKSLWLMWWSYLDVVLWRVHLWPVSLRNRGTLGCLPQCPYTTTNTNRNHFSSDDPSKKYKPMSFLSSLCK